MTTRPKATVAELHEVQTLLDELTDFIHFGATWGDLDQAEKEHVRH